jgi:glucose/mannose transport system substrate-binding protein
VPITGARASAGVFDKPSEADEIRRMNWWDAAERGRLELAESGGVGMRRILRRVLALGATAAMVAVPACSSSSDDSGDTSSGGGKVEVFSWWTGPGEEDGLNAMIADFKAKNAGVEFINAAVSGGAGSNAKAILAGRLQAGDPPDSYQRHAGLELQDDIKAGKVQDLSYLYDQQKWRDVFPQGLVDKLTIDGKIYSVPVNIHRSNLLYSNPKVLAEAGISAPPRTWAEFLGQAEKLKAAGRTAISIGPVWTQKHLLENVLLGELGADRYESLWDGRLQWTSAEVTAALETYKKVLSFSDIGSASADWQPALDKLIDGAAAYNVMGDWADAYLSGTKKLTLGQGYDVAAAPGTEGVYNFLSDTFTLPVGAKNRAAAEKWLVECGSKAGQDAFNPKKGSIPARKDADKALYKGYLANALTEWQRSSVRIVGSLTHGVVANNAWNAEIDTALGLFVKDGDVAKFAASVQKSYEATK